jgi:hypothetical protein
LLTFRAGRRFLLGAVLSNLGEVFLIDGMNCRHCRRINKQRMVQLGIAEIETKPGIENGPTAFNAGVFARRRRGQLRPRGA